MTAGLSPLLDVSRPSMLNVVELLKHFWCFGKAIHTIVAKTTTIETFVVSTEVVTLLIIELWTWRKLLNNIE